MRKNSVTEIALAGAMLVLVCFAYRSFYNNAFSGYEAQGAHIWLSASTVKFVNNWLKEGLLNLNFVMYEYPTSIEFNSLAEREAYISYPPGAVIPVYILAKTLHKNEIQVGFIKAFLKFKFLFDTLLVCLIAYSIFRWILRERRRNMAALASVVLALSWMCIPLNLYYLRNVYFADQCIISVALFFILLEIYDDFFTARTQKIPLRYLYLGVKFIVSLYGVLTDYYFLFVLFVSWLVKIIPLFKTKNAVKNSIFASLVYVLPVVSGIGLFITQIMTIPNYKDIIFAKMKLRMFSDGDSWVGGNKIIAIIKNFIYNYSVGASVTVCVVILCTYVLIKNRKDILAKYKALFRVILIVYVPPVLQVLVLQNHSAIHEFSLLKFALPVTLSILVIAVLSLELKGMADANFVLPVENSGARQKITVSVFYSCIIAVSIVLNVFPGADRNFIASRVDAPVSYERENLIRANYHFNDVYFSFTESISANPPQFLVLSKKLIYKIDDISEIRRKFPNLNPNARILLIINKDDSPKSARVLENEAKAAMNAELLFSSEHYAVYSLEEYYEEK